MIYFFNYIVCDVNSIMHVQPDFLVVYFEPLFSVSGKCKNLHDIMGEDIGQLPLIFWLPNLLLKRVSNKLALNYVCTSSISSKSLQPILKYFFEHS